MPLIQNPDPLQHLGESADPAASEILSIVLSLFPVRSAVDVGCGTGEWVDALLLHGIKDVLGIDKRECHMDHKTNSDIFVAWDLEKPILLNRRFDLVLCMEVAEHLPARAGNTLIDSLTALGPVVLFSAAIPFQGGTGHQNEQWPQYWADLFEQHGFVAVDCIRRRVWQNPRVDPCYAQNTVLFVSKTFLAGQPRLQSELCNSTSLLPLVHPEIYLVAADPRRLSLRRSLLALPKTFVASLLRKLARRHSA